MIPIGPANAGSLVEFGAWLSVAGCAAGAVYTAAKLTGPHQPGERLMWTLAATVIAGLASALLGALA